MKDKRFIELVNLYIDRQITAEEMAALEDELQANPRRRAIYRDYCKMHRATTLVYESFRSEESGVKSSGPAIAGGARIAQFESEYPRRRRTPWGYYASGLAAACVALVFARIDASKTAEQPLANAVTSVQEAPVVTVAQAPVTVETAAPQVLPSVVRPSSLVAQQDYAAMLAAMRREEQRAFASGAIQSSRPVSLFEDGVFDSPSTGSTRIFRNKPSSSTPAEFAAFQFQR